MSLVSGPGFGGSSDDLLYLEKHVDYISSLDKRSDEYEYWLTEHLRLNGIYWGLTALYILKRPLALPRDELISFVMQCWHPESGGFGAAPGHDPHMLYTCSAVQILAMTDALHVLDQPEVEGSSQSKRDCIGTCEICEPTIFRTTKPLLTLRIVISSLQDPQTGTFHGDEFGEPDTRFLYNAFNALSLLKLLHLVDVPLAVSYIEACANADGGYGTVPGAESHSGQIFVCLAALSIAEALQSSVLDRPEKRDRLAGWLAERQLTSGPGSGGLNGRPEKKEDVCYSWWVVSSLAILDRVHWLDRPALRAFILSCQDPEHGGISDRPGDVVDVFHTHFGLAGLSLVEWSQRRDDKAGQSRTLLDIEEIDPV
jgi:geranylgeranyl transferase type-2 subunit beta